MHCDGYWGELMKGMSVSLFMGLSRTVMPIMEQVFLMLSRGTSQCHLWSWHLQSLNSTTEPQLRKSCYFIIQILHNGWFGLSNASIKMLVLIKTRTHVILRTIKNKQWTIKPVSRVSTALQFTAGQNHVLSFALSENLYDYWFAKS